MLRTVHEHDDWNADARGETPMQRADRAYGEILQEVRVAQTGVQILFAFLLALAFQARFGTITSFQRGAYVVTLMLCAGSTALLIAPAALPQAAQAASGQGGQPAGPFGPGAAAAFDGFGGAADHGCGAGPGARHHPGRRGARVVHDVVVRTAAAESRPSASRGQRPVRR